MKEFNYELLPYMVGGLLYVPAVNESAADKITSGAYPHLSSVAFCLEDSVMDEALGQAEQTLLNTLGKIRGADVNGLDLPLIFVRVRSPEHLKHISGMFGETEEVLTGYILPKFDLSNAAEYIGLIEKLNADRRRRLFAMPILESAMIAEKNSRIRVLSELHEILSDAGKFILNVRVGGNDFCNLYGLRRSVNQTVYDVGVVRDVLVDILNVFVRDFVVSGPVWEYFGRSSGEAWADGLRRELELDRLNGFIGKTAVHPSQLPLIAESLRVSADDYEDALSVLSWNSRELGVSKSSGITRMNEVKCHTKWAERVRILGEIYGVREDKNEKLI